MTNRWIRGALLTGGLLAAGAAWSGCVDGGRLTGVNMAGAEFNSKRLPGVLNKDYIYPTAQDLAYFASKGANTIRLPIRWERAQRTLMGELDPTEMAAIAATVSTAAALDLCVILDAHNYATYYGKVLGSTDVPAAAFNDFWMRMAQRFPDPSQVAFGLMNEPKAVLISQWAPIAQGAVNALRDGGSQHLLLVSGGRWAGIHEWSKVFSGTSNATAFANFKDPLDRMAIEVHQYADSNFSGTGTTCLQPSRFPNMFSVIGDWARNNGHRLFLGETGVAANEACLQTLDTMLALSSAPDVWLGFTYWAAGRWWGTTYSYSIQPKAGVDAPQMSVVSKYLGQ